MVLIPSGIFEMGRREIDNEQPIYTVEIPAFYMDIGSVTVGQYRQFVGGTGYKTLNWRDILIDSPTDDHPIIYVNWHDAMAYTQWVKKRLPTEVEWEYAARGGLDQAEFPWSNSDADPHNSSEYANYYGTVRQTNIGGTYPVNGYGPPSQHLEGSLALGATTNLHDVESKGGCFIYWPGSHLSTYDYFVCHPEQINGSFFR